MPRHRTLPWSPMLPGSGSSACKLTPLIHYPPSAGVCFQEPVLQAADLEEEETGPLAPSASAPPPKHESLESRIATQLTSEPVPAAPRVETPRQAAPKRRKMSTSVALPVRVEHSEAERPLPQAAQGAPTPPSAALAQLPPLFQRYMASKGFAEPTPVQDQTWAPLLAGRDVQAVAEPGAGKTLTFLLPAAALLEKGAAKVPAATATVLVLEPTRELAQQVGLVWKDLARLTGAQAAVIHGGVPKQEHVRGEGLGGVVFVLGALSETEEDEVRCGLVRGGLGGQWWRPFASASPESPPITALPTPASTPPLLKELLVMHTPVARDESDVYPRFSGTATPPGGCPCRYSSLG